MEKQDHAFIKSLKHFKTYVGNSKIICYIPHAAVKDILSQQDCLGIRGKWVSKIQEYVLEIRDTKLFKGLDLAKMLAQQNEEYLGMVCQNNEPEQVKSAGLQQLEKDLWYADIIFFLLNLTCPDHLKGHKRISKA